MLKKYPNYRIVCLDKLTYAGNLSTLKKAMENEKTPEDVYEFKLISPMGGKALECAQEPDYNALLAHIRTPFNTRLAKIPEPI